jgi:hypothetical protein
MERNAKTIIGFANHVHADETISSLEVAVLDPDVQDKLRPFITIRDGQDSVIVHGRTQFRQLIIFLREALDNIDDDSIDDYLQKGGINAGESV